MPARRARRKTLTLSAGKYKTEGHPFGALPAEARAFIQSRVDDHYGAFTRAVAKGRNVAVDQVRGGMGQGRLLGASQALSAAMVDGIDTMDGVLRSMASGDVGRKAQLARLSRDPGAAQSLTSLRRWLTLQETV